VIAGILPRLAASLSVGVATAGQLVTAYALAYAVLTPVMATLTASWPRRRVLLTGLSVFGAGNAATTLLPWFGAVLAGRVLAGLGGAMVTPVALATAVAIAHPGRQGRALSVVIRVCGNVWRPPRTGGSRSRLARLCVRLPASPTSVSYSAP
jgi:DHA1 family inner membrane transport protein